MSYLPDYNPANSDLFAGLIQQIVSCLPDYENFSVILDDISVHVVLWCRKGLPELFRQITSFDFQDMSMSQVP